MTAHIDSDAREWLALIEERKREFDKVTVLLREESRRREKLKSEKFRKTSDELIAGYEAQKTACEAYLDENTRDFFQAVFGVNDCTPVALQDAAGKTLGALIATEMTARLLSDGTGVFTISGDSLDQDVIPGLPQSNYLLAQESAGQRFVPLA